MNRNLLETIIGGVVLLVAGFFLYFAYSHSTLKSNGDGYELIAKFDRIDGLLIGSEVRLSGVKVGTIVSLELDHENYLAVAKFSVRKDVKIPADSSAEVQSDGLLGDKYLALVPGGDEIFLKPGEEIINTQSAINLTDLIGKAIFNSSKKEGEGEDTSEEDPENNKAVEEHKKVPQDTHKGEDSENKDLKKK